MTLDDAYKLLDKTYGEHLQQVYVPSLQRKVMFKPLTTAHIKMLARNQFINEFQLPIQVLKLSLFDKLCAEDLSGENISSKTINTFDYLAFLIGIRQMLDSELTYKFTCSCNSESFNETLKLDQLFDDIISDFKPQNLIYQKVDETTNTIWKFQLTNYTMIDYLYYRHIIIKLKQKNQNDPNIINSDTFLKPLLYIKNISINDEQISNWNSLLITQKLKFFNNIPSNITINTNDNDNLILFIKENMAEEKLFKYIHNLSITCPHCHKQYGGVYDIDNFFIFQA